MTTKHAQKFKNQAEADEYLSLVYALDSKREQLVQRRQDGTATKKELELLDAIALGQVNTPKAKLRKAMQYDHIAFEVLLDEMCARRAGDEGDRPREDAKEVVGKRLHVGHNVVDEALKRLTPEKEAFFKSYIASHLSLIERLKNEPETISLDDFDLDARLMLGPCLPEKT